MFAREASVSDSEGVGGDRPTSFRLPIVVDDGNVEMRLGPMQRIRIAPLARQEERVKFAEIVLEGNIYQTIYIFENLVKRDEKN